MLAGSLVWPLRAGVDTGEVDPVGAALASVGLGLTLWSTHLSVRTARWQETDIADLTARLAVAVRAAEANRAQALGGTDRPIDLQFRMLPTPALGPMPT